MGRACKTYRPRSICSAHGTKNPLPLGMGSVKKSRHIVLLASGEAKAEAVKKAFLGDITPLVPASILQLHPAVTLIVDKESGAMLP